jgi:hypothetical protein
LQGVVTPVNHAGGVVCSIRAARSAGEPEVAPELVIIAAAGGELPEFTWMPDGRVMPGDLVARISRPGCPVPDRELLVAPGRALSGAAPGRSGPR